MDHTDRTLTILDRMTRTANSAQQSTIQRLATRTDIPNDTTKLVRIRQELETLDRIRTRVLEQRAHWAGKTRVVVMAGPNEPETLTLVELGMLLSEFELDEVLIWARRESGDGLDALHVELTGSVRDDQFAYFTGDLKRAAGTHQLIATISWSRKL